MPKFWEKIKEVSQNTKNTVSNQVAQIKTGVKAKPNQSNPPVRSGSVDPFPKKNILEVDNYLFNDKASLSKLDETKLQIEQEENRKRAEFEQKNQELLVNQLNTKYQIEKEELNIEIQNSKQHLQRSLIEQNIEHNIENKKNTLRNQIDVENANLHAEKRVTNWLDEKIENDANSYKLVRQGYKNDYRSRKTQIANEIREAKRAIRNEQKQKLLEIKEAESRKREELQYSRIEEEKNVSRAIVNIALQQSKSHLAKETIEIDQQKNIEIIEGKIADLRAKESKLATNNLNLNESDHFELLSLEKEVKRLNTIRNENKLKEAEVLNRNREALQRDLVKRIDLDRTKQIALDNKIKQSVVSFGELPIINFGPAGLKRYEKFLAKVVETSIFKNNKITQSFVTTYLDQLKKEKPTEVTYFTKLINITFGTNYTEQFAKDVNKHFITGLLLGYGFRIFDHYIFYEKIQNVKILVIKPYPSSKTKIVQPLDVNYFSYLDFIMKDKVDKGAPIFLENGIIILKNFETGNYECLLNRNAIISNI